MFYSSKFYAVKERRWERNMKWYTIIFENKGKISDLKRFILQILEENEFAFVDKEFNAGQRFKVQGINRNIESLGYQNQKKVQISITEVNPTSFFDNTEQFLLNCELHHELDLFWFPYYFDQKVSIEKVIKNAELIADDLTLYDEGYNSHISNFWGFFVSLGDNRKREEILNYFRARYDIYRKDAPVKEKMINIAPYVEKTKALVKENKINYYFPKKVENILRKDILTSKLQKQSAENAKQDRFYLSELGITNRWYLNALYVSMVLMNLSVIDRYFLNYCISQKLYEVDQSCREYIRTGEERIWMRRKD